MENKTKPIDLSWQAPILGGDCPHCGEWGDYQEQNEGDEGWDFYPCESKNEEDTEFGTKWSKKYKCPNCSEEVEVRVIEW